MKPKNLKYPFSWEERRPYIHDGVFFVPQYFQFHQDFPFPGWESEQVFGNNAPVSVELCSGNGLWIAHKARLHPETNWVAVEKRFDRVRKIWSKRKNDNLSNLFVVCGEGRLACSQYFPPESVNEIFVNFPDPWPKKRHARNRIVRHGFAEEMAHLLQSGGRLTLVTDDPNYSNQMLDVMLAAEPFAPHFEYPYYINEWEEYGSSWFEELWRGKGCTIKYHVFEKTGVLAWT